MKKTKLLAVFGLLLALGVTACNKTAEEPKEEEQASSIAETISVEPHKNHKWDKGEITKEPTCDEPGVKTFKCTVTGCPETKTESIEPKGHTWGEGSDVEASGEGVAYKKFACTVANCQGQKYEIPLKAIATASGVELSSTPDPFIKLATSNTSFTFKFNSEVAGSGKLYIRATMDHWTGQNTNTGRTLFTGKEGNEPTEFDDPNLSISVNGKALKVTNKKTMGELFPATDNDHPAVQDSYSPVADLEYGEDLAVIQGLNEVVFKRVNSFNPAISHLVLVFKPAA